MIRSRMALAAILSALAGAAEASVAPRLTGFGVLANATPVVQAIMLLLVAASLTAVALWGLQAAQGDRAGPVRKAKRLAMLSAISGSAPLFGLAAASYTLLNGCIGLSNVRPTPDLATVAPGLAEAMMATMLGLLAAAIAAAARRVLDAPSAPADGKTAEAALPRTA